jgi:hypothetical protein
MHAGFVCCDGDLQLEANRLELQQGSEMFGGRQGNASTSRTGR